MNKVELRNIVVLAQTQWLENHGWKNGEEKSQYFTDNEGWGECLSVSKYICKVLKEKRIKAKLIKGTLLYPDNTKIFHCWVESCGYIIDGTDKIFIGKHDKRYLKEIPTAEDYEIWKNKYGKDKTMKNEPEKPTFKDIFSGEHLCVWRDDENIFFEVFPNGIILNIPIEYWRKFKKELKKLVNIQDEAQSILDEFRPYTHVENLFVPTFQSVKDPMKLIKVLDSKKYTEEDAKKVIEYFKHDHHTVLIVWDYEMVEENKEKLQNKILEFCGESIGISDGLATA